MELATRMLAVYAIFAAAGLIGVVALEVISSIEDAEARGCNNSIAFNASQGRCFHP
jgi:hypothetical protein